MTEMPQARERKLMMSRINARPAGGFAVRDVAVAPSKYRSIHSSDVREPGNLFGQSRPAPDHQIDLVPVNPV